MFYWYDPSESALMISMDFSPDDSLKKKKLAKNEINAIRNTDYDFVVSCDT
jgi:hypothetical protein